MRFLNFKKTFQWTTHSRSKMRFYRLSEQRVKQVIHSPRRVEEGIAPNTVAMMQPVSVKTTAGTAGGKREETWNQEIWVMLKKEKLVKGKIREDVTKIISAWRYPGMTKPGQPLPAEILREAKNFL